MFLKSPRASDIKIPERIRKLTLQSFYTSMSHNSPTTDIKNASSSPDKTSLAKWLKRTARALPLLILLLIAAEREARAYTDPGTGALLWQMLAAGFVGLMFYTRKFTTWFKARRKDNRG